uniref:DUF834 domain-containing protein n=1 Tax=Oryza glumipatula TaxID=40148 RepID=A0A0E0B832_9ORYZ
MEQGGGEEKGVREAAASTGRRGGALVTTGERGRVAGLARDLPKVEEGLGWGDMARGGENRRPGKVEAVELTGARGEWSSGEFPVAWSGDWGTAGAATLWVAVGRPGKTPLTGGERLKAVEVRRLWCGGGSGAPVAFLGKGGDAEMRLSTAEPMVAVAWRGDGRSGGGGRLESTGGRWSSAARWEWCRRGGRGGRSGCRGAMWSGEADGGGRLARRRL